jgi:hypothetical protein
LGGSNEVVGKCGVGMEMMEDDLGLDLVDVSWRSTFV